MRRLILCVVLFASPAIISSQTVKSEPKVALKPEVKLGLVQDQNDMYKLALQMKQLEAQYQASQAQMAKLQAKLQADTKDALVKSGIDETKYEINAETFDVTAKLKVDDAKVSGSQAKAPISK